jgi:hypothetical protein
MNADGSEQTFLTRGSSATWSPDCNQIAFHASASGTGTPTRTDPGSATNDSDIFVANVDDLVAGVAQPKDITNSSDKIDDDADWSPDGQHLVYTAHDVGDDIPERPRLPLEYRRALRRQHRRNGPRAAHPQHRGGAGPGLVPGRDADRVQLPDRRRRGRLRGLCDERGWNRRPAIDRQHRARPDRELVARRPAAGVPSACSGPGRLQLFTMAPNLNPDSTMPPATQLTTPPGINLFAHWGELRVHT